MNWLPLKPILERIRPLADAVVILGIGVVLLAVVEQLLRLRYPEKVPAPVIDDSWLVPNSDYVYTLAPDVTAYFTHDKVNGGHVVKWETNSQGFRGRELASVDIRIAVYGDSNIQARFTPLEHTFPARLETSINELSERRVSVVNAGVDGYGPDQSYLKMEHELAVLKPDIVVLNIFADNDFGDLLRNRLFDVSDGRLIKGAAPLVFRPRSDFSRLERLRDYLATLLITRSGHKLLRNLGIEPADDPPDSYIDGLLQMSAKEYQGLRDGGPFVPYDHYDADLALGLETETAHLKLTLMKAIFQSVQRLASLSNIKVLVSIEPSVVDVSTNLSELNFVVLSKYADYRRDRLTSLVQSLCEQAGLDCLNLFPVFNEHDPNTLYFRKSDNHWNDAGQNLAARTVANHIVARYLNVRHSSADQRGMRQDNLR